jgi:hypothetical protein
VAAELDREVRQVLDDPRTIRELPNLMNESMRRAPWSPVQLNDARRHFLQVLRDSKPSAVAPLEQLPPPKIEERDAPGVQGERPTQ